MLQGIPCRASAMAAANPPMPPPAMSARPCMEEAALSRGRPRRRRRHEDAKWRVALGCVKRAVVLVHGRAIGTYDRGLVAHVEIDMGMIEGRRRPHALKLLDANPDPADALVVHGMGHESLRHGWCSSFVVGLAGA